ncbi:hypothetical protein VK70_25010 [Paenibacillus durus ATCC 35681]|uniref:CN hydrolase domain-containing protein n=2 Tax=Paenibacillus durus TaxID=44251 RepID=A0A0F7FED5_PAEDU|nr:hypothetical protein VK70_25010 [Paenibacillus durus ATCC 35681]
MGDFMQIMGIKKMTMRFCGRFEKLINHSADSVDLVVMPELFSTGYFFDSASELMEIAEEIPNG